MTVPAGELAARPGRRAGSGAASSQCCPGRAARRGLPLGVEAAPGLSRTPGLSSPSGSTVALIWRIQSICSADAGQVQLIDLQPADAVLGADAAPRVPPPPRGSDPPSRWSAPTELHVQVAVEGMAEDTRPRGDRPAPPAGRRASARRPSRHRPSGRRAPLRRTTARIAATAASRSASRTLTSSFCSPGRVAYSSVCRSRRAHSRWPLRGARRHRDHPIGHRLEALRRRAVGDLQEQQPRGALRQRVRESQGRGSPRHPRCVDDLGGEQHRLAVPGPAGHTAPPRPGRRPPAPRPRTPSAAGAARSRPQ